jgi:hypothetical protein
MRAGWKGLTGSSVSPQPTPPASPQFQGVNFKLHESGFAASLLYDPVLDPGPDAPDDKEN